MKKVKLGSVVKIKTGKLDANAAVSSGKYPFFTCAQTISRIDKYSFDCECVLIAGNGELNAKYYLGKFDAYQRTYVIESKDIYELKVKYLFYFLSNYIVKLRQQSIGGVIKYIKLEHLTLAEIPLPDITKQEKIIAILDTADALRQKNKELLATYDELLQATFLDMFGDPVVNSKG